MRLLSGRFEYLFGVIPTTPIRDQRAAEQLSELVKNEAARGELDVHQKIRAVDIFFRYLWSERQALITPFNEGPESGADYVLSHIRLALEQTKNASRPTEVEEDSLDFCVAGPSGLDPETSDGSKSDQAGLSHSKR